MRRPRRRRLLRFMVLMTFLMVIAGIALTVAGWWVLRSDWPRRIVVDIAGKQTGLEILIDRLEPRLSGGSIAEGVRVTVPFESTPIATVSRVRIEYNHPITLLWGGFRVDRMVIEQPELHLRQSDDGRWNVQAAIDSVVSALGSSTGTSNSGGLQAELLPELVVTGGRINVLDMAGRAASIQDIAVHGRPDGPGVYALNVQDSQLVKLAMRVSPQAAWRHEATLDLNHLNTVAEPWSSDIPADARLQLKWRGLWDGNAFNAKVEQITVDAFDVNAQGDFDITASAADTSIRVKPQTITLTGLPNFQETVLIRNGMIALSPAGLHVEQVAVLALGQQATLDLMYHMSDQQVTGAVVFGGDILDAGRHNGKARFTAQLTDFRPRELTFMLEHTGRWSDFAWSTELNATATAAGSSRWRGTLNLPHVQISQGGRTERIEQVGLAADFDGRIAQVFGLALPGTDKTHLHLELDTETRAWRADVRIEGWTPPVGWNYPTDVTLDATGVDQRGTLNDLRIRSAGIHVAALGDYDAERPVPLSAHVAVRTTADAVLAVIQQTLGEAVPDLAGAAEVRMDVTGALMPPAIDGRGRAMATGIRFEKFQIPDVEIPFRVHVDPTAARAEVDPFTWFGGQWRAGANVDINELLLTATLSADALRIAEIGAIALPEVADLVGELDLAFSAAGPLRPGTFPEIQGRWTTRNVAAFGYGIDEATGRIDTDERWLKLHEMTLRKGAGQARGELRLDHATFRIAEADLSLTDWSLTIPSNVTPTDHHAFNETPARPPLTARADGQVNVTADVMTLAMAGTVSGKVQVMEGDRPIVDANARGRFEGQTLHLSALKVMGSGVEGDGQVTVHFDKPWTSTGEMLLVVADLAPFGAAHPMLEGLRGSAKTRVTVGPATDRRSPEPLVVLVEGRADADLRTIGFGDFLGLAFVGPDRILLHRARAEVAEGNIEMWASFRPRPSDFRLNARTELINVNLDRFRHAFDPESKSNLGRGTGTVNFVGNPLDHNTGYAHGDLRISQSDLAGHPMIERLYDMLNLRLGPREPRGRGSLRFDLQQGRLRLVNFDYFNSGVSILANGVVSDIRLGDQSPVRAFAVANLRPLKDSRVPFAGKLDATLAAFQGRAASVRATGTIGQVQIESVPVGDAFDSINRLLSGRSE